jgi:hypothetical protein
LNLGDFSLSLHRQEVTVSIAKSRASKKVLVSYAACGKIRANLNTNLSGSI